MVKGRKSKRSKGMEMTGNDRYVQQICNLQACKRVWCWCQNSEKHCVVTTGLKMGAPQLEWKTDEVEIPPEASNRNQDHKDKQETNEWSTVEMKFHKAKVFIKEVASGL